MNDDNDNRPAVPRRVRPLNDFVFVAKDDGPEKIGRIIVPPSYRKAQRDTYHRAVVLAVGPGRWVPCQECAYGYPMTVSRAPQGGFSAYANISGGPFLDPCVFHGRTRDAAVSALRASVRDYLALERSFAPTSCKPCKGSGLVRVQKVPLRRGDVVYINENISGKTIDPNALGLEAQLGTRPIFVIPSNACGLAETFVDDEPAPGE